LICLYLYFVCFYFCQFNLIRLIYCSFRLCYCLWYISTLLLRLQFYPVHLLYIFTILNNYCTHFPPCIFTVHISSPVYLLYTFPILYSYCKYFPPKIRWCYNVVCVCQASLPLQIPSRQSINRFSSFRYVNKLDEVEASLCFPLTMTISVLESKHVVNKNLNGTLYANKIFKSNQIKYMLSNTACIHSICWKHQACHALLSIHHDGG